MKKLKKLNQEDLDNISNFLSNNINDYISANLSSKEILDMDINIEISYNDELKVDIAVDLELDELSKADANIANTTIENSLSDLNSYLDENFRV